MVLKNHATGTHKGVIRNGQRGFTLIESAITAAIASLAIGTLVFAIGAFARFSAHQAGPVRVAATLLAEQTLRVAQNSWKYGSPGDAPVGTIATTVPVLGPNGATSAPVLLQTQISGSGSASAQITVTVLYTPEPDRVHDSGSVTLSGELQMQSPLPDSTVAPASLIPQPSGAP
jgi:prepilin-type N-terminal cleavage/methylation domain-containing protein